MKISFDYLGISAFLSFGIFSSHGIGLWRILTIFFLSPIFGEPYFLANISTTKQFKWQKICRPIQNLTWTLDISSAPPPPLLMTRPFKKKNFAVHLIRLLFLAHIVYNMWKNVGRRPNFIVVGDGEPKKAI